MCCETAGSTETLTVLSWRKVAVSRDYGFATEMSQVGIGNVGRQMLVTKGYRIFSVGLLQS